MASMSARYQAQADAYFAKQQEIKLTIDTSSTNDRFSQLIAESIQSATKTGLSTSPVGSLP
jgi:ribonuclease I